MSVKITHDGLRDLFDAVKKLTQTQVLVGIPESANTRDGEDIGNAALGYIHEFGAPEANIPARPFLVPAIESMQDKVITRLRRAGVAALDGKPQEMQNQFNRLGLEAVKVVKDKLEDGPFVPLAESTKRARLTRTKAYQNASLKTRQKMMKNFLGDPEGIRPLIDMGKMRDAVTYVIVKKAR